MKTWIAWKVIGKPSVLGYTEITVTKETNLFFALCLVFWWSFSSYEIGMTLKNKAGYIHGK